MIVNMTIVERSKEKKRIFLDDPAAEKKTYAVSNDRTILVNGLDPGRTYVTRLVAADGIESETASDPQMITTLAKGKCAWMMSCSFPFSSWFSQLIIKNFS